MPSATSTSLSSATFTKQIINLLLPLLLIALALSTSTSHLREQTEPVSMASTSSSVQVEAGGVPKGLTANDWSGIRGEYERHRHAAFAVAGEYRARNSQQQWRAHFDGRGFIISPNDAGWSWGLELKSYGFAGYERSVPGKAEVRTAVERVSYKWNDELEEWFINERRGLEHGFTIKQRPERGDNNSSLLRLRLAVRGGLKAKVQDDGQGMSFTGEHGAAAINYTGLKVWDADNKGVKARMSVEGDEVSLLVEESEARYPLTIDPLAQQAYLKASNADADDSFGSPLAISGETVVVGASGEDSNATGVNGDQTNNDASNSGAAYVFVRNAGVWTQQAYLKASNTEANDFFGASVAISGETIVVGAGGEDSNATGVNGDQTNNSAFGAGAAYVFVRNAGTWSQQAYLKASNTDNFDGFGFSVAISGETIVVGAFGEDSNATGVNGDQLNTAANPGAAYVYVRNAGAWSQQAYLKASNTDDNDNFGWRVAISGETIVVGAPWEQSDATGVNGDQTNNNANSSGAAYVFVRNAGTWAQQAYLKASNTDIDDLFGWSVAISGETIVVGAFGEDSNATGVNGDQTNNSLDRAGAAYVFVRNAGTWAQQAYLKGSDTNVLENFGATVAISGETIVVGASGEDSNATGVDGDQSNNDASNSGAAYVFVRNAGTWAQHAYLKASNTESEDIFGAAVAISGETIVVGAPNEDSNATGVNGDQTNNDAPTSGAVYVFTNIDAAPIILAESGLTRQAGSPVANSTIATVNDLESGPSSVTVTVNGGASATVNGVTVSNLVNTNGVVTADIVAACGATDASFTLTASDGSNTAPATLNVTVTANTAPSLSYPPMPSVVIGNSTMVMPTTATDNGSIASYSIINVVPPLNTVPTVDANGVVSITNAAPSGNHTITVRATDNCGVSSTASFSLNVICSLTLPTSVPAGTVAVPYSASVAASANISIAYSVIGGSLPPGLSLNQMTGAINGTPTTVGNYSFIVKAQTGGCNATQSYSLAISCPTITVNPGSLSAGTVGSGYSVTFGATPAGSYTFNVSAGALPPGLTLNQTTGKLSGTPTAANTYSFTITATRSGNCTGSQAYSLTINPAPCPPSITLAALPNGKAGQYYFSSASASPSGSYSYQVTEGSLPPGLSLSGSNGFVFGNPTMPGLYNFTITATRNGGGGCTGSRSYSVMIASM